MSARVARPAALPPAALAACALAGGVALAIAGAAPPPDAPAAVGWGLPVLLALAGVRWGGAAWPAAWLLAGWMSAAGAVAQAEADCRHDFADGQRLTFHGTLASLPGEGRTTLVLAEAFEPIGTRRCGGLIRIRMSAAQAIGLRPGAEVTGRGRWLVSQYAHRLVPERAGTLVLDALDTGPAQHSHHPLLELRGAAQRRVQALFGERAPAVNALLLARKEGLDPELRDRYAAAGIAHLLAISGLHIGLIAAVVLAGFGMAGLSASAARAAAAIVVAGYVLFIGAPASAVRACLMLALLLAGRLLQRPSAPLGTVAAAAVLMMAWDPLSLAQPGFQLSFAGAAGLLVLRPRFLAPLPARLPRWLRESLATSAAATVATAPVTALHFQQIAPVGVIANLVAIPLATLLVPAAALALVVSVLWLPLGAFLADGTGLLIEILSRVATAFAAVPLGHLSVSEGEAVRAALVTTAAALAAGALPRHDGLARRRMVGVRTPLRLAVAGGVLVVTAAWLPLVTGLGGRGALEIHMIDVGQGDAIALRSPAGRWLLIDTGPRTPSFDAGRSRVLPYLEERGVRRLEALVLTHPHADHIGGAAAIMAELRVELLMDPGLAWGKPMHGDLLADATTSERRWLAAREGRTLRFDGVDLDFLHPVEALEEADDANEESVVVRLRFGATTALFMGDAGEPVEARLIERYGESLRAHVLKVGHHGSRTASTSGFLRTVRPELALVSAGRRNRFGHPHAAVLARYDSIGARVLRTDRSGAVVVRIRPGRGVMVVRPRQE